MKTLDQALRIIEGSKQFDFVEGQNGCTVLEIINYFTGERLRLDLAYIDDEILDSLQVEETEEVEEEFEP